ncbi:methyltransferase domain-containing protein [bacterium]|nr:methyltransferase domain-containing protein [bacterium]
MYDQIGKIAVLNVKGEIKKENLKKIKEIGKKILKENKHLETILLKKEKIKGRLRKAKYKHLCGKKNFETLYKENNCLFKLNLEKVYFNPRLATNRLFVAQDILTLIKSKKIRSPKILVAFCGVGVYGVVIGKILKKEGLNYKKITMVELNREAIKYAKENVLLNKLENFEIIQGDVKKILPRLKEKFEIILAPRPKLKNDFLKEIFLVSKRGSFIYYFDFVKKEEIGNLKEIFKEKLKNFKKRIKIFKIKKAGEISPSKLRVLIIFKLI